MRVQTRLNQYLLDRGLKPNALRIDNDCPEASPRTLRLLRTYWDRLTMMARAGGYFGRLLMGYRGVTQGDLLSPIILNVVVDTIIHHWVTVVTPTDAGTGGLCLTIIDMAAYFYADNGLVLLTQPERLHRAFNILTGFLD